MLMNHTLFNFNQINIFIHAYSNRTTSCGTLNYYILFCKSFMRQKWMSSRMSSRMPANVNEHRTVNNKNPQWKEECDGRLQLEWSTEFQQLLIINWLFQKYAQSAKRKGEELMSYFVVVSQKHIRGIPYKFSDWLHVLECVKLNSKISIDKLRK